MNIFDALIIGVVEGITEFLPVSSTGHMIVVSDLLGLVQDDTLKSFEVVIQSAAIAAVVLYYARRLRVTRALVSRVAIASLPVLGVGYVLADTIKGLFDVTVVAVMFVVGGIIFLITEYVYRAKDWEHTRTVHDVSELTMLQAAGVGVAQVLALVPGTSRSGATIIGGLWLGLSRTASAEFSFLLAVPVMAVVTVYDVIQTPDLLASQNVIAVIVGFVTAFVVAYGSIVFFLRFLTRHSFVLFGVYRIVFGLLLLLFFV